jgi:hypothetical protein
MSWFKRLRSFSPEEEIKAGDFEAEYDNLAEALNGLVAGADVRCSESLTLTGAFQDVPGASATITLSRASLVFVWATWGLGATGGLLPGTAGSLSVDGAEQPVVAEGMEEVADFASQSYCLKLTAGSHTIKQRARLVSGNTGVCIKNFTGFTYLVLPNPEP